jgi:DNA invertase Pin-like site-specific DNA recombinase
LFQNLVSTTLLQKLVRPKLLKHFPVNIGYARISTGRQNPDSQHDALEEAGCERIFMDIVSGAADELPRRAEALDRLRKGDVLVVRRLPRLGRSLKDLLEVVDFLEERGAHFRSVVDGLSTDTAHGRMVFQIFGAVAEFERELIRERTLAGLESARRRGRKGGRPPALSEKQIPVVQKLMRDEEVSTREICETFSISRATLYRYVAPDGERRR